MRRNPSATVTEFLESLPGDRQRTVEAVRALIRRHLPHGYEEVVAKNMLVYQVPLSRYADTYNGYPLWYVALASEKSYLSLHLMPVYGSAIYADRLREGFRKEGKRLNMGKACVRFRKIEDLALDPIGELVGSVSVDRWVEIAQSARSGRSRDGSAARATARGRDG